MPHSQVIQAQTVLSNEQAYPEIIVAYAKQIEEWSQNKRKSMQWLWSHRELLHAMRRAKKSASSFEGRRKATRAVTASISEEELNEFHRTAAFLRKTETSMGMSFGIFDALLKTLACQDLARMHSYFACSNAQRKSSELNAVAFLQWVNGRQANEVLMWRLVHTHG